MGFLAAQPHDPRSRTKSLIARDPADLPQNVEVTGIGREGEVHPGLKSLGVRTKGQVRRYTAKSNLKFPESSGQPFYVLAVARVHDVCVVRHQRRTVKTQGNAANDDKINVSPLEAVDERTGVEVSGRPSTESRNRLIPRAALAR